MALGARTFLICPAVSRTLCVQQNEPAMAGRTPLRKHPAKARDERLEARISRDQKALFQRAAALQGRTLTDFVVASVHEAAVRTIEDMQSIQLSVDESRAFAEALLNPRKPVPKLKAAARRYLEIMRG
jgi:uncharacterized protein (DUF1778 family)